MTEREDASPGEFMGPAVIFRMLNAAQESAVLCAAIELGVFKALADGELAGAEVAGRIGCPVRTTLILLDALAALKLLAKRQGGFSLAPLAAEFLVPGKPLYAGDMAGITGSPVMWEGLSRLGEAVRAGGSVLEQHAETPDAGFWGGFARSSGAMATGAALTLELLTRRWIRSRPRIRVLDVAAGSGIYGYTLVKRHPNVELTVLDWPHVVAEARQWASRLQADPARVSYVEGSLFDADYGTGLDLIVMSHVYHHFDPPTCLALTRKAAAALAPGGKIAIHEFLSDDDDVAGAMFAVTMLAWTRRGTTYSSTDYRSWLEECGFGSITIHENAGMPSRFILAEKTQ